MKNSGVSLPSFHAYVSLKAGQMAVSGTDSLIILIIVYCLQNDWTSCKLLVFVWIMRWLVVRNSGRQIWEHKYVLINGQNIGALPHGTFFIIMSLSSSFRSALPRLTLLLTSNVSELSRTRNISTHIYLESLKLTAINPITLEHLNFVFRNALMNRDVQPHKTVQEMWMYLATWNISEA